ncbi:MAG TPA: transglycosylase SLT domain-containing protein [Trebonia sp.]|jgi:SLT domain-containing protein|nr:transglycosylase SLT domain-containing protein [Trebonia sp.]
MAVVKSIEIDIGVKNAEASKAKIDAIDAKAEHLKKIFGDGFALKIDSAAASEKLRIFRAEMAEATKDRTATVKVKVDDSALQKFANSMKSGGGPAWLGPAIGLLPAAGTLTGVAAGAAVGLSGAVVAGGAALAAFGAVAKPVLADALKAEQAVNTAQNNYTLSVQKTTAQYQIAMSTAKTQAQRNAAYAAEQKGFAADRLAESQAISKAYVELSPQQIALSKQLGNMANAWQNVKAAETPVVAGALQPWLQSVTSLTGDLAPIIAKVAPVIGDLGTMMNNVVTSPPFITFRNFIANQGSYAVLTGGSALIDFFDSFVILLPKFTPLITMASNGVGDLGQKVLNWSQSAKASQDITKFMDWFRANGPVVGGLLKNIGLALQALAPGLTAGGITELKIMSDFFGLVAKLPPAIAKPLLEVAGVMLTLNKLGVFSVGVKFTGKVASWLTGGVISIGSGTAAAAEMQAAMTAGGASAAAEIRAAMGTGGAAAGAEVGAGEAAGGTAAGGAAAVAEKAAAPAIGTLIGLAIAAQIGGYLAEKQFSNLFSTGVAGASSAGGAGLRQAAGLPAVLAGTGTNTSLKISVNTTALDGLLKELGFTQLSIGQINKLVAKPGANVGAIDALIYQLGGTQSDILAVNKLIVKPHSDTSNVDALLKRIGLTPPQIAGVNELIAKPRSDTAHIDAVLAKLGLTAQQIKTINGMVATPRVNVVGSGSGSITATENILGMKTQKLGSLTFVASGGMITGGIPGKDSVLLAAMPGEVMVPKHMVDAGAVDHLRGRIPGFAAGGLVPAGMAAAPGWAAGRETAFIRGAANSGAGALLSAFLALAGKAAAAEAAPGVGSGVARWTPVVDQALAMLGLSLSLVPRVLYQMQTESGGNPQAINLSDFNATVLHDPSRGLMQVIGSTFAAFHVPGTSGNIYDPLANIAAALHYGELRYGPTLMTGGMGIGSGHGYDSGGYLPPGLSLAYNGTGVPEPVIPASRIGKGGDVHYHVTVNVPHTVNPREAGREVAQLLLAHTKTGGRLYPPGTAPR